ncbi:hypothetical protein DYB32_002013 [Aphanomyces invadans]|uniref:Uncharacterized protein n=1 Tax=Aphanomyces invadans TaxID=157072 RepID=A0A418B4I9_9STRA|nr:hypothetical protein DYB32_002013 [Aphanomyces invadans]
MVAASVVAVSIQALPSCSKSTLDGIKSTFYELPTDITSACDATTPGFKLIDYFTTRGSPSPSDAQVENFTKAEACKVVFYDLTQIIGRAEACEYYPGEPLARQAGFPSLKELTAYRTEHDKASSTTAVTDVPSTACTQASFDRIKATYYELPQDVVKACAAATPGFSLIDYFTTKGSIVSDAQIELFSKAEACKVVYYDLVQIIGSSNSGCDFYPGQPLAKQASFPSLAELVAYRRIQDSSAAVPQSTLIAPQQTIVPCDVSQIDSVMSTIKALPVYAPCSNASGFDFVETFRRTKVYPSVEQLQRFATTPACQILYADVQRILSNAPVCVFYDKTGVTLAELAKFTTLDTLVSFQMKQEGFVPTHAPSALTSAEQTSSSSPKTLQSILIVAGIAAGLGVIFVTIMYLRRKWAKASAKALDGDVTTTAGSATNQSIFVVNANSAL